MTTWQAFVMALIMQESEGNNLAIGDNGAAHGPLQIQERCIIDVNKYRKEKGWKQFKFPEDCYDRQKAEACLIIYTTRLYATEERLGRKPTYQDYARIWNGGPDGYRNRVDKHGNLTKATKNTIKYWEKLKNNHSNP